MPQTTKVVTAVDPTATTVWTMTSIGQPPSCGWRHRRSGISPISQDPSSTRAEVFDLAGFDFNRVAGPSRLDLAVEGAGLSDCDTIRQSIVDAALRLLDLQEQQPWDQPYAPSDGWDWGSNGRILNNLVVLATAHTLTEDRRVHGGIARGMDYLLGRNALGQSYVTGYGIDSTVHQRTRQFGHDLDAAFPPPPREHWRAARTRRTRRAFPATRGWLACRLSAAISTSQHLRPPTTSASVGTRHLRSLPRISA